MFSIARKTLFEEKVRFAMGAGGVALAVMLILVLQGMLTGVNRQITAYLDAQAPQLVVAQKDSRNFLGARSTIPRTYIDSVERVNGVTKVVPVIVQYVILESHGRKEFSLMIGFDRAKGGGPWEMRSGRSVLSDDEVIFDAMVADRHRLRVGDYIEILGKRLRIAGLSGGTSSWMTGTFFVTYDTASELLAADGNPSFLLVSVDESARASAVGRRIELKTDQTVTERTQIDENDRALYARILSGPIKLMVVVAFLIGVTLVGLTTYTATVERTREYGALKAIGMRNTRLYAIVLEQSLISSIVGFVAGVALAFAVRMLLDRYAPQFLVSIEWPAVLQLLAVAVAMGAVSALVPARAVAGIDPVEAFRRGA